jgi:hypothetical protein
MAQNTGKMIGERKERGLRTLLDRLVSWVAKQPCAFEALTETILQPFAAFYFFQDIQFHSDNLLKRLNFLTLHSRRRHSDGSFY